MNIFFQYQLVTHNIQLPFAKLCHFERIPRNLLKDFRNRIITCLEQRRNEAMSQRRWNTWPKRFGKALTDTGGVVGIVGIGISAVGATVAAPIMIGVGGVTICGALIYAGCKGIPPKMLSAAELVGTYVPLQALENIHPNILKLGILGYTQSGKTTFLKHALQQMPDKVRTSKVYAAILALQITPVTYVALLDGDGEQFAQQFEVAEQADFLLVFVDHNHSDDKVGRSKERIEDHDRFLKQLEFHISRRKPLSRLHIVLNKRDLWEKSKNSIELKEWFEDHVQQWKKANIAKEITSEVHSNLISGDIGKILRHISEMALTL